MSAVQSYLASSAVAKRMEEMRQKEADTAAAASAAVAKKLEEQRRTVEIASVNWETEVLLAVENMLKTSVTEVASIMFQDEKSRAIDKGHLHRHHHNTPSPPRVNMFYEDKLSIGWGLSAIQQGIRETSVPSEWSLINERARLRIRILTEVFHSLQAQVRGENLSAVGAALDARISAAVQAEAEKKAVAAAAYAAAMEAQRIKMNAQVNSYLLNHPNINTLQHNFTDTGGLPTLFAAYRVNRAQPTGVVSTTAKGFLEVLNVTHCGSVTPAFSEYMTTIQVPESWSHHYTSGLLPFLTCCPTCGKAPAIRKLGLHGYQGGSIGHTIDVQCESHYRWNPDTNQHYKWVRSPPQPAHMMSIQFRPDGYWAAWDPKDPDGVKAAKAVKDKQIAEKEEQIRKLQAELLSLRTL